MKVKIRSKEKDMYFYHISKKKNDRSGHLNEQLLCVGYMPRKVATEPVLSHQYKGSETQMCPELFRLLRASESPAGRRVGQLRGHVE